MDELPEFKVVLIGDAFVGKTSLINRFYRDTFNNEEPSTIAASYLQIPVQIPSSTSSATATTSTSSTTSTTRVKLNVWDTAGHERFHCIVPLYSRTADCLIVVFDITTPKTFENAKSWFATLSEEIGKTPVSFLVANKVDLDHDIDVTPFAEWATENRILFEKTSAMSGENVQILFTRIAEELLTANAVLLKADRKVKPPIEQKNDQEKQCC